MERDSMLNVRIPGDLKAAVKRAADDDHGRSVSGMVVRILSEWCATNGYLKDAPKTKPHRNRS
jgi:hypothetical protein